MLEFWKAVLFGVVEGITEWLPVSSTGHLILLDEFVKLEVSDAFYEMFQVVIQLGAILAVIVLFWGKLDPIFTKKSPSEKKETWLLWSKVVVAILPSALVGLLLDDWMDAHLYNYVVVAVMLVIYGAAFIWVEKRNKTRKFSVETVEAIDCRTALLMGTFQCLSLVPGTSRSGATILGGIFLGISRAAAAEFSFFMAIPTMLGASALKLLKFVLEGSEPTTRELMVLIVGCLVSFMVSLAVIRGLMAYVRRRSFSVFGVYRIVLGALVLIYFLSR